MLAQLSLRLAQLCPGLFCSIVAVLKGFVKFQSKQKLILPCSLLTLLWLVWPVLPTACWKRGTGSHVWFDTWQGGDGCVKFKVPGLEFDGCWSLFVTTWAWPSCWDLMVSTWPGCLVDCTSWLEAWTGGVGWLDNGCVGLSRTGFVGSGLPYWDSYSASESLCWVKCFSMLLLENFTVESQTKHCHWNRVKLRTVGKTNLTLGQATSGSSNCSK